MNTYFNPLLKEGNPFFATPLEGMPTEIELPFSIYFKVAGKMTCFRKTHDKLTIKRKNDLLEKIDTVYIPRPEWQDFLIYLERTCLLDTPSKEETAKNIKLLLVAHGKNLEDTRGLVKRPIKKLRTLGYKLADFIYARPNMVNKLLNRYTETDIYYASHNANVAVYSIAIAHKLEYELEEARQLGFACLVHNIGNGMISDEILYKESLLNVEEKNALKMHSEFGAQILEYMNSPSEAVILAKQHHERFDGTGYPFRLKEEEIHPFARICSIADIYDSLLTAKPHEKKVLPPTEAVAKLRSMEGHFDPRILSKMTLSL